MPDKDRNDRKKDDGRERGDRGEKPRRDKPREEKEKQGPKVQLFVSGTHSRATLTVKVSGKVEKNTVATFWVGTDAKGDNGNPYILRVADIELTHAGGVLIDPADGIGKVEGKGGIQTTPKVNLSEAPPEYTHIIAVCQGTSSNQALIPASGGEELRPEKPKVPPAIEIINAPRDPDPTTGMFLVTVATRENGKPVDRNFAIIGNVAITPNPPTRIKINEGLYQVNVGFNPRMAQIIFQLDTGQQASVWLRK